MSFFSDMHKSIFDPDFCREIVKRPRGRVVLFLVKTLVFTALVMCVSKTYYLLHSERGLAPLVSAMFGDVEIRDGRLVTERETPFGVSGDAVTELMNRLVGTQRFFGRAPDDFLVVDAGGVAGAAGTDSDVDGGGAGEAGNIAGTGNAAGIVRSAKIVLGETGVDFREMRVVMPYRAFVGDGEFRFTAEAVQAVLDKNAVAFAFSFFLTNLFFGFFTMTLSIFFLSLAAYVFRADREKGYRLFLRLSCYCITPVMLGDALVSVSGVNGAEWMWHVFIIVSTVLMFRAMTRLSLPANKEIANE